MPVGLPAPAGHEPNTGQQQVIIAETSRRCAIDGAPGDHLIIKNAKSD